MTPQVFISGMHIADDGTLVIHANEMAEANVKSIEFIEGTPEARIAELSARLEEYNHACETLGIKKDVLAYISGLRTGYDMEIEALEARLKEAKQDAEMFHRLHLSANHEVEMYQRDRAFAEARAEEIETLRAAAAQSWAEASNRALVAEARAEAAEKELLVAQDACQSALYGRDVAWADAGRLREALRRVEWVSGWDVEGHKAIYCPWCNRIKGFGHTFGCIRQAALAAEQSDDEKGVKG